MRGLALSAVTVIALALPTQAQTNLSAADRKAAFEAAGFTFKAGQWQNCEPEGASYSPGSIDAVQDVNGDGRPEAILTEGGAACFGMTGTGFSLVSKGADSKWKLMASSPGIPTFLNTKGMGGWPDIEVGGPGFCFPVLRWNGKEYEVNRFQYEGKPCRRPQ